MRRLILQLLVLLVFISFFFGGYILIRHVTQLPFRATNDYLHEKNSPVNLDFLIPAGTYLDDKITIGEVLKTSTEKKFSPYDRTIRSIAELIPAKYRYLAGFVFFFFWVFTFMTLLRVFTFFGYGRALRISLLLGGITYYFMPDFSPGNGDDILFISFALLIIVMRFVFHRRKKRERRHKTKDNLQQSKA